MGDNVLLVPMQLNVMVMNQQQGSATPFSILQMNYSNLSSFLSPEPQPFQEGSQSVPPGIYLHWTMPKALRHGVQQADGTTAFPYVPNRWLIVRTSTDATPAKAWVVESDYLGTTTSPGTSGYVDPVEGRAVTIGRSRLLSDIGSLPSQLQPFLQAVGPGNVAFAAYAPAVEDVFAFVDDTVLTAAGTFNYSVIGWYSDAANDPLSPAQSNLQWVEGTGTAGTYALQRAAAAVRGQAIPAFLPDWYVYATAADLPLPLTMVLHAQVSDVAFDPAAPSEAPPNFPTDIAKTVRVAVGNTAVDALSALLSPDPALPLSTEAALLQAFQYNLLETVNQPGSSEALKKAIRSRWFGASPGGTLWTVAPAERQGDRSLAVPAVPALTPAQVKLLAALNRAQAEMDRQCRVLESMEWSLMGLWWKVNFAVQNLNPPAAPLDAATYAQLAAYATCENACATPPLTYDCLVKAEIALVANYASATLEPAKAALLASISTATQILKPTKKAPYHHASDPVVLISGLGATTDAAPADGLLCRLPSQLVGALTVGGVRYSADGSGGTDIAADVPVLQDAKGLLPGVVHALHRENYLLSPTHFATRYLAGKTDALDAELAALRTIPPATPHFAAPQYATQPWVQPWVPVLMEWKVDLLAEPAYKANTATQSYDLQQGNWTFDGADFVWSGSTTPADFGGSRMLSLSGRTFITAHLSGNLADQIKDYLTQHGRRDPEIAELLQDLENGLAPVKTLDLLSQRLSGMMAGAVQRSNQASPAPNAALASLFGDTHRGVPNPAMNPSSTNRVPWNYTPCNGTFFRMRGLTVIDSFGRSVDVMLANDNQWDHSGTTDPADYFLPCTAPAMTSPMQVAPPAANAQPVGTSAQMIQLAPRLVQDAQLRLTLLSNDGNDVDIDLLAEANPVCGWLVPNHLDRSLAVYAPDGTAWGELYLSRQVNAAGRVTYTPVWQGDPVGNGPALIDAIPSVYVRNLLTALSEPGGERLANTLKVIDETLWTIDPRGTRQDQDLSVLIGRPLAVVRASAALKLRGLAYTMQDWEKTFDLSAPTPAPLRNQTAGVTDYTWPVLLGSPTLRDDGLIGYFADDAITPANTWNSFNAVCVPADAQNPFLKAISPANVLSLKCTDDSIDEPDAKLGQRSTLTLLLDPRGQVHAFSGLLPVATIQVPDRFLTPALNRMCYLFRSGPLLTSPAQVRLPLPAERNGTWAWFDHVLETSATVVQSDGKVRFETPPPVAKEGWLKLTPNTAPSQKAAKP